MNKLSQFAQSSIEGTQTHPLPFQQRPRQGAQWQSNQGKTKASPPK